MAHQFTPAHFGKKSHDNFGLENKLFIKNHINCFKKKRFNGFDAWIQQAPVHFINIVWDENKPRELCIITKPTIFDCSILNSIDIFIENQKEETEFIIPSKGNGIFTMNQVYQHLNNYLTDIHEYGIVVITEKYMSEKYKNVVDILEHSIKGKEGNFCFIRQHDLIQNVLNFFKLKTSALDVSNDINSYTQNCQIECCVFHKNHNKPNECCFVKNVIYSAAFQKALIQFNVNLQNQDKLIELKKVERFSPVDHTYLFINSSFNDDMEILEIGSLLIKQSNNEYNGQYIKTSELPTVIHCLLSNEQYVDGKNRYQVDSVVNHFIENVVKKEKYDFIVFDSENLKTLFNKHIDLYRYNILLLNSFYSSIILKKLNLLPYDTAKQQQFVLEKQPPKTYICDLHNTNQESCVFYKAEGVFIILNWFLTKTNEVHTECPFDINPPQKELTIPNRKKDHSQIKSDWKYFENDDLSQVSINIEPITIKPIAIPQPTVIPQPK